MALSALIDSVGANILAEYNTARMKKLPASVLGSNRQLVQTINYFAEQNNEIEKIPIEELHQLSAKLVESLIEVANSTFFTNI